MSSPQVPILSHGVVLGGTYRIGRELGRGGMGAVYEAEDLQIKRRVAIKILLPEAARLPSVAVRFDREADAAARVDHPSVVQVIARGRTQDDLRYLVMEYVEGESLSNHLNALAARRETPTLSAALHIAWQIAHVLAPAHERGIVHRDLKPANIMLQPDPLVVGGVRVKILDFGVAKFLPGAIDDGSAEGQTNTGDMQPGTVHYMPLEQFQAREFTGLEGRMDVYALGVILFRMLTGRLPLFAPNAMAMMCLLLETVPPPLSQARPELPPELCALVDRMLARQAGDRPTMAAVRDELAHLLPSPQIPANRPGRASSPIPPVADRPRVSTEELQAEVAETASALSEPAFSAGPIPPATASPPKHIWDEAKGVLRSTPSTTTEKEPREPSVGDRVTGPAPVRLDEASQPSHSSGQQVPSRSGTLGPRRRLPLLVAGSIGTAGVLFLGLRALIGTSEDAGRKEPVRVNVATSAPTHASARPEPQPIPTDHDAVRPEQTADAATPVPLPAEPAQPTSSGAEAPEAAASVARRKPICVAPTATCLSQGLSPKQQAAILAALDEAEVKLCSGQRLVLGAKPVLSIRSSGGVPRAQQDQLLFALRGALKQFPLLSDVSIQCKGK